MSHDLVITGAREHNLKDISLRLPRDRFIVITGLSGSGKCSLAFDTIYAEGQRRYVESLSAYARQFLGQMDKPDVDSIEGLSPAISIDQKTTSRNPRSTVGTVTEIYDYLRLLYARIGHPHCPNAGAPSPGRASSRSSTRCASSATAPGSASWRRWCAAARVSTASSSSSSAPTASRASRWTARCASSRSEIDLDKKYKHDIAVVVDRLVMKDGLRRRLTDSVETAAQLADGLVEIETADGGHAHLQREVRLRALRHLAARDPAAHLQLQQPARRLPDLSRPRRHAGDRPRPRRPRRLGQHRQGRAAAVRPALVRLARAGLRVHRQHLRRRHRQAVGRAAAGAA